MPATRVRVDDRPDRVVVTLDRPDRRNAIDQPTIRELHAVCADLEERPRPLLVTGTGEYFAAGADIAELRARGRDDALRRLNAALFDRIARLPQPTVAALNGPALGGGAELAYACDIRLATEQAYFANPEPGLGVVAAGGAAWRLAELVGRSAAKQVLLGGYRIGAADALRLGLVAEVVPSAELLDRAERLLERISRQSALALRLTKLVVDATGAHPLSDDLAQALLFESSDKAERMDAFLKGSRQ